MSTDKQRVFTGKEIAQCAKDALDNWDFDVELENGRSPEYVAAMKDALTFDANYAAELWCEDGPMELNRAYGNIWDFLDEFANNMASQI